MIITISGKAESGKDLTATLLKKKLEDKGKKVLIFHYADYLKFMCKQYFGWDGVKDDNGRTILQKIGTDIVRKRHPEFWVEIGALFMKVFQEDYDYFLIPDCRFPDEIDMMCQEFDTISVHVERIGHVNKLSDEQRLHPSETALDGYVFDHYIRSESGEESLSKEIDKFLDECIWIP